MPRLQPLEHPTTEIHAPWWSDDKDAFGRYMEHAIIRTALTLDDMNGMMAQIVLDMGRTDADMGFLDLVTHATHAVLLMAVAEITDDTGAALRLDATTIKQLSVRDVNYIAEQINLLNGWKTETPA